MSVPLDIERVRDTVELLEQIAPDTRLLQLKNLCVNNGVWSIPEDPRDYQPVLYEIGLFGIPAVSDDVSQLPRNWMFAARNVLNAQSEGCAA